MKIMIIGFYSKAHTTINNKHVGNEWVSWKLETNDKNGGILVSEQQQSSGKNEWSGNELDEGQKARWRKKERKNVKQEARLCQRAQASGHYPLTLPLKVYDGYQPINICRKWTNESCANPLVKRSPSWCLVSILTREILWEGSSTLSRNQWYLIA